MDCYQAGIPPHVMHRQAGRQHYGPSQQRLFAQPPAQQWEQQIQKQDTAQEPLAHAGKIHRDPARGLSKIIQPQDRQQQAGRFGCGIIPRLCDKTDGKKYTPRQPEHGVNRLGTLLVKARQIERLSSLAGAGILQRRAGNHKEQRGAKVPQIDVKGQHTAEQFGRQCKIPGNGSIEMNDQNAHQRHGADEIQIKQALFFHRALSFRLRRAFLTVRPIRRNTGPTPRWAARAASSTSARAAHWAAVSNVALV